MKRLTAPLFMGQVKAAQATRDAKQAGRSVNDYWDEHGWDAARPKLRYYNALLLPALWPWQRLLNPTLPERAAFWLLHQSPDPDDQEF